MKVLLLIVATVALLQAALVHSQQQVKQYVGKIKLMKGAASGVNNHINYEDVRPFNKSQKAKGRMPRGMKIKKARQPFGEKKKIRSREKTKRAAPPSGSDTKNKKKIAPPLAVRASLRGGTIAAAMDRFKDMDYEEEIEIYLGDEDSDSDLPEYEDSHISDYLEEQPASSIAAPEEEVMTAAAEMTATGITATMTTTTTTTTATTTTAAATTTTPEESTATASTTTTTKGTLPPYFTTTSHNAYPCDCAKYYLCCTIYTDAEQ